MKTPMPESRSTVGSCAFMLQVLLALLLVTFVFGSNAHAAAFTYENTTVKAIPDNTCPTYAAVTIPVADNFTVNDLNVGINITHTYHADLSIRLKSPLGTTVALSTGVGGSSDNFDILFDDSNATSITSLSSTHNTASPYYENLFRPASPLSAFNGENVQGNWSLEVCDSANSDTGSVNRVRLDFTGNPVTGTLSGLVYMDSDSDNSFDAGDESGIDSIKVSLYDENFTPNNTADDIWLADTDTAGGGTYSFSGLDTDKTYRILVNTADTSLPAGAAIGTTNPLTLVAFPVGTTDITGKDFGFDPVITDKDFGDAPATYGDASHYIVAGIHLGNYDPDAETASHYSFNARADLFDDGAPSQNAPGAYIPLFPVLQMTDNTYSASFKVTNTTGTAGKLYGWIDFDQSGTFEADEGASVDVPTGSSNATAILNWASIPTDIELGTTFIRLRLTTDATVTTSTPTGLASNGEVEDYPIAVAMDIPPNSPSVSIVSGATPAACEAVVFEDDFDDLSPHVYWGANRSDGQPIRDWVRSGGGADTYARTVDSSGLGYGTSIYFGNGAVRRVSPSISGGLNFDANGKLLTVLDAVALRDDIDDTSPGSTANSFGSESDWGPQPVTLSRTFATTVGKTYRLYFKAIPEDIGTNSFPKDGVMRLDVPGGSIHFKVPKSSGNIENYAVEFTAVSTSSTISFMNYGHFESGNSGYCDPNSVYNGNAWCTAGGDADGQHANELIIDDVVLAEAGCPGSISGTVYDDDNGSNSYDAGSEPGIGAVSVSLYDNNSTPANTTDDTLLTTVSTAADGSYSFIGLDTGLAYRIEVDEADTSLTGKIIGTPNPIASVVVTAGATTTGQDFGFDTSAYSNDYCVTPSGTTGFLNLGDMSTSLISGAGSFNYSNRVLPGYGTVDISVTQDSGAHNASTTAIDTGARQQPWLDENLPVTGTAIYMGPGSNGTTSVTYNFDQPTGNVDLLVLDVDENDVVSITAKDGSGVNITDFSKWRYRSGDLSVWANPDPVASAPAWDPVAGTLTSTEGGQNDHRSFGLLTPDTLVTQITVTFAAPAVSGQHVYTILNTTATGRDGETSCAQDYGDAPATYGDASHMIVSGIHLGNTPPDGEPASQPSADASGDGADEDGISSLPAIPQGSTTYVIPAANIKVTNTTGGTATLYGFIDFNGDGDFADTGESASVTVASGASNPSAALSFSGFSAVPNGITNTFARFRLSTDGGLGAIGAASDGEVEDYTVAVIPLTKSCTGGWSGSGNVRSSTTADGVGVAVTFGTAAGAAWNYYADNTLNTINAFSDPAVQGATSLAVNYIWDTTPESDSSPASFDAAAGTISVAFDQPVTNPIMHLDRLGGADTNSPNSSEWTLTTPGASITRLAGVGHFITESNKLYRSLSGTVAAAAGESSLDSTLGTAAGSVMFQGTFSSINFSLTGIGHEANAADGFEMVFCAPAAKDYSDAPTDGSTAPGGSGTTTYGIASHKLTDTNNLKLGATVTPDASAVKDADNGSDDAIAVFPTLTAGDTTYTIPAASITGVDSGTLHAWIDFDGNGSFDADEHASVAFNNGASGDLTFSGFGATMAAGTTYARFRLTSGVLTAADFATIANDGEVEDYALTVTATGSISGKVWFDSNGDGIQNDGTDSYIENTTVELMTVTTGTVIATTTSNASGEYQFTTADGLQASTDYHLRILKLDNKYPVSDWVLTSKQAGSDSTLDSDAQAIGSYWLIEVTSPAIGTTSGNHDFGFINNSTTGCLNSGATGVSNDSIANAHPNTYDFEFNSQQVVGFCSERTEGDPQAGDNYSVNATDRQGLTTLQREKIARSYSALTDPDIIFGIASAFGSGNNQKRLDDLLHYMTWYYTYYGEDLDAMSTAHLDTNSNYTADQRVAMKTLAGKVADRVTGSNGETQYAVQDIFWLWNMTSSSRQDIVVPAIYAAGSSCIVTGTISGTVYTDSNGDDSYDSGTESGIDSITVTLLNDSDSTSIATTSTSSDGSYSFSGLDPALTYSIKVDMADSDLAGKTIGTINPLPGVSVTAGSTTANQNFGFDPVSTVSISTPPAYNVCKSISVEQLDAFKYATATGSGASGTPSLTYTAPSGSNRFMVALLSFERDHTPTTDGRGDNFETNPGVTFPTVTFGGVAMQQLAYSVDSRGSSNNFADAETSRSYYLYGIFDLSIPSGAQTVQVSGVNAPTNAGDEAILAVATFANVASVNPVSTVPTEYSQTDRTTPFNISLSASPAAPTAADQPPGTSTNDNMLLAFGTSSRPENLTIGAGWNKLAEIPLSNPNGTYATDSGRASGPFTENDGHTLLVQAIKGVSSAQAAEMSSTSNDLSSLTMQVYRFVAQGCDYGDAPSSYGDASHSQSWSRRIGALRGDAETATPVAANAAGDDSNNLDDEDGVTIPAMTAGQSATISVNVAGVGYLSGWIDWNGDGDFNDSDEQIATDLQDSDADGTIQIPVNVPATATTTQTYARFRWSINTGAMPTGWASYGEVEDYVVSITNSAFPGSICSVALDNSRELIFNGSNDGVLETGTMYAPGSTYRVSNISPGIDGIVTLNSRLSDSMSYLLDGNIGAQVTGTQEVMKFDMTLRLVDSGTSTTISTPVDLVLTSLDIDGDSGQPYSDGVVFYDADATFTNTGSKLQPTYYSDHVMYTTRIDARGYNDTTTVDPAYGAGAVYKDVTSVHYGGIVVNNTNSARSIMIFGSRTKFDQFTSLQCDPVEGGVIRGTVYTDIDKSDTYNAGDSTLPNISVSLYDNNGTTGNTADDTLLVTSPSESDGRYNFGGLNASRTYRVQVSTTDSDLPAGYTIGTTNPLDGVSVTAGGITANKNFGFDQPVSSCSLIVTTTADTDNAANNSGSLRDAIECANSTSTADTITFNIPTSQPGYGIDSNGDGYWSIKPTTPLPGITQPLVIDGSTQPGTTCPKPRVEINGSVAGLNADGIGVYASNSTIKGLIINNFSRNGILLSRFPINFPVSNTLQTNNSVECSYIGVDASGLVARPNMLGGIAVEGDSMKIGGTTVAKRNVISGNGAFGIYFYGGGSTNGTVQGNYIGVGANGTTALGNNSFGIGYYNTDGSGLIGGATGVTVNGVCTGACNIIANNTSAGVGFFWTGPAGRNVRISSNSIHSNGGIGIDLEGGSSSPPWALDGVTPNDAGDADPPSAPNALQNYPVLGNAVLTGLNTVVSGTLNSIANATFTIEFFANTTADPSGYGEGERYLGNTTVTTDASGNASFSASLPTVASGTFITSTATDASNNTSEFSAAVSASLVRSLSGKVFEDVNYSGTTRGFDAAQGMAGINGATVELRNSLNAIVATTTTVSGGDYSFTNIPVGIYTVRLDVSTVKSTRPHNGAGTELGVITYRSDTALATTAGATAAQTVTVAASDLTDVNFGFNFDTVSNTNNDGEGSLRQFIINANLLGGDAALQQAGLPAGKENAILKLATTDPNYSGGVWTITLNSSLPNIDQPLLLDGSKQATFNSSTAVPVIELNGNGGAGNGLTLVTGSSGSQIRSLEITNFSGDGINVQGNTGNNSILGNSIHSNGELGIDLVGGTETSGVTENDIGDGDSGPNSLLNYPEFKTLGITNGSKIITYEFDLDVATGTYRMEFFKNGTADASGHGEGQIYLGGRNITVTTSGNQNYKGAFNANQVLNGPDKLAVTLTRMEGTEFRETSEFSGTVTGSTTTVCEEWVNDPSLPPANLVIDENITIVAFITAKDASGNTITYALKGVDGKYFTITASGSSTTDCQTIQLVNPNIVITKSAPADAETRAIVPPGYLPAPGNYEVPMDSDKDNVYQFQIIATYANGQQYTRDVGIQIMDVNEAPIITSAAAVSFNEDTSANVLDIISQDPDAGTAEGSGLTYSITGGTDANQFEVAPATGILRFRGIPDYDAPTDTNRDNLYEVEVTVTDDGGLSGKKTFTVAVVNNSADDGVVLNVRALLQGAYDGASGLMSDALNAQGLLPTQQPYKAAPFNYAGAETLSAMVQEATNNNAVVDWVLVDLRSSLGTITATRAVMVQRDGDLVDAQTGSPDLHFANTPAGNYYVSVRHRNHLGIVSASPISLDHSVKLLNLASSSTPAKGEGSRLVIDKVAMMWAGDLNASNTLTANGPGNDVTTLLGNVITDVENQQANTNFIIRGYLLSDLNMDGKTLSSGPNNDASLLVGNIILHPLNTDFAANFIVRGGLSQ